MKRIESPSGAHAIVDGRTILNFGGCPYLGLTGEPELTEAGARALRTLGSLGQMPRHYGFELAANLDAEAAAADYFGVEAAMYFATGYLFGLIALQGLASHYDLVLLDESAHYSLRDGAASAGKPVHTFKHLDSADLARVVEGAVKPGVRPLLATDGMFPTFGSIPPLADYVRILAPHDGWLIVDESHSFGVLGPTGRGAVEHHGVEGPRTVAGGSLGKAFCAYGGLAIGTQAVIDDLWKSPPARGAASGMSSGAAMSAASMRYMRTHPKRLVKLRQNVRHIKDGLRRRGLDVGDTEAPVATFVKGTAADMKAFQAKLMAEDIFVIYSTYVGAGPDGAIRCAVFADHEPEDIDRLLTAVDRYL